MSWRTPFLNWVGDPSNADLLCRSFPIFVSKSLAASRLCARLFESATHAKPPRRKEEGESAISRWPIAGRTLFRCVSGRVTNPSYTGQKEVRNWQTASPIPFFIPLSPSSPHLPSLRCQLITRRAFAPRTDRRSVLRSSKGVFHHARKYFRKNGRPNAGLAQIWKIFPELLVKNRFLCTILCILMNTYTYRYIPEPPVSSNSPTSKRHADHRHES